MKETAAQEGVKKGGWLVGRLSEIGCEYINAPRKRWQTEEASPSK